MSDREPPDDWVKATKIPWWVRGFDVSDVDAFELPRNPWWQMLRHLSDQNRQIVFWLRAIAVILVLVLYAVWP